MALLLSVGASGLRASHGSTGMQAFRTSQAVAPLVSTGFGTLLRGSAFPLCLGWPLTWLALRTTRTTHVGDVITGRKGRSLGRCQRTLGSSGHVTGSELSSYR